jgi:hypothetical protein
VGGKSRQTNSGVPQSNDSFVATVPLRRTRRTRSDNINTDFQETGWDDVNWIRLTSGFGMRGGISVLNLQLSQKAWNGLCRQATIGLLWIMLAPSSWFPEPWQNTKSNWYKLHCTREEPYIIFFVLKLQYSNRR